MNALIDFLVSTGKLKTMKRRGWVLRNIKNPETIASHIFRTTLMAWILCYRKKFDITKALKISLVHDLCEVFAGDTTPYDKIFLNNKKKRKEILHKWPRLLKEQKEKIFLEKYRKENKALKKLIKDLPLALKEEITNLWNDYENGLTKEGRFVRQLDRVENLLQALEYRKQGGDFAIEPWWIQIEELIDDPLLLEFMAALEKKFHKPKIKKR